MKGISPDLYYCDHCDYKCPQKADLQKHIQAKHLPKEETPFVCPKCNKPFSKEGLRVHKCGLTAEEKEKLKIFKCSKCEYKTDRKGSLKRHEGRHKEYHPGDNKCTKCGRSYRSQRGLSEHAKKRCKGDKK